MALSAGKYIKHAEAQVFVPPLTLCYYACLEL